ncbi:hypothetical protein Mapa_008472 [Marchantia paleacea]|nr:hypothetical protein Mapa_008472 [Marchantia paleacea]
MGEEKDLQGVAETGTRNTSVKKESTVKDSFDAVYRSSNFIAKESEAVDAKSQQQHPRTRNPPKVGVAEDIGCQWKRPSTRPEAFAASRGKRDTKDVSVAAAAATNRLYRQQRQWKTAIKVMSRILSSISPIIALRRARDCYVTSLGSVARHVSHSTACGVTYGAGHSSLDTIPAAWRSGSSRFQDQLVESERSLSAAFKESFNDTASQMRTHRRSSSVPLFPTHAGLGLGPAARSPSWRAASGRAPSASSRFGMQPMAIYTIKEA